MPTAVQREFRERAEFMSNAFMQQVRTLAGSSRNYVQHKITAFNQWLSNRLNRTNSEDDQNWSTTTSERHLSRGSSKISEQGIYGGNFLLLTYVHTKKINLGIYSQKFNPLVAFHSNISS